MTGVVMKTKRDVHRAIADAERVLPGHASTGGECPRWQAIIAVGMFIETDPLPVCDFAMKWAWRRGADLQRAISCCLIEHLLEHHFDLVLPRMRAAALEHGRVAEHFYGMSQSPFLFGWVACSRPLAVSMWNCRWRSPARTSHGHVGVPPRPCHPSGLCQLAWVLQDLCFLNFPCQVDSFHVAQSHPDFMRRRIASPGNCIGVNLRSVSCSLRARKRRIVLSRQTHDLLARANVAGARSQYAAANS